MSFGPVNGIKVVIARATSKVRELTKSKLKRKSMKTLQNDTKKKERTIPIKFMIKTGLKK